MIQHSNFNIKKQQLTNRVIILILISQQATRFYVLINWTVNLFVLVFLSMLSYLLIVLTKLCSLITYPKFGSTNFSFSITTSFSNFQIQFIVQHWWNLGAQSYIVILRLFILGDPFVVVWVTR